jgi:single-strand DNA-binding protein
MFDTNVTIVGNVLHGPEWRKTTNTGALVTTFKIASTARRFDRQAGQWMDGNSLRVRVNCWRALAANVKESVAVGDPVIVTGRIFTRDWIDENGVKRLQYEVEATAIGHDLSRGNAVFQRRKPSMSTSVTEDAEAQQRIGGELTEAVPDDEAPTQFDDTPFEVAADRLAAEPTTTAAGWDGAPEAAMDGSVDGDSVGALHDGGFTTEPVEKVGAVAEPDELSAVGDGTAESVEPIEQDVPTEQTESADSTAEPAGGPSPRRRGLRRSKASA